jgi:hypothetical protein
VTLRGPISPELLQQSQLQLVGMGAGSLVLELVASESQDMFGHAVVSESIDLALDVFRAGVDRPKLATALGRVKGRAFAKYSQLINQLALADSGLSIMRAAPQGRRKDEVTLTADAVKAISEVVRTIELEERRTIRLYGRLIGVNIRTLYFELQELQTRAKVVGRILEGALQDVEHAIINGVYLAEISEILEVSAVTGEEHISRQLVRLFPGSQAEQPSAFGVEPSDT